eukprot:gene9997-biopygen11968
MHACTSCSALKSREQYSKTQFAKGLGHRRCKDCVAQAAGCEQQQQQHCTAPATNSHASAGSGVSTSISHLTRNQKQRTCKDVGQSLATEAARSRRVRVRDVQRHFGHLCQIPLEAYIEADVAHSWNDFVSEEDVMRASDAWDARSICYDIDTQWGDMPWGGAYSDSNHYYGPGMYDF